MVVVTGSLWTLRAMCPLPIKISFLQDLEPNWFRRARLTSPADSRRAPGIWSSFTCTRTGACGRTVPSRDNRSVSSGETQAHIFLHFRPEINLLAVAPTSTLGVLGDGGPNVTQGCVVALPRRHFWEHHCEDVLGLTSPVPPLSKGCWKGSFVTHDLIICLKSVIVFVMIFRTAQD